ncbi:hypothetical protein L916_03725 [Phytophthora nicotianae]|uniref:Uncharacterized protein n=1 Tax=Phytophthora nicotianae TaxID=4792 RepID=W2JJ18_PHYNI|nr:hypothetical protein L916_03725 [Phytophthora nicotianae]
MVDPYISTINRLRQAIGGTGVAACVLALPVVDVAVLTAPVLMAGVVTTSAIGTESVAAVAPAAEAFAAGDIGTGSVAVPVVATCALGAKAVVVGGTLGTVAVAAIVVGIRASDKDVSQATQASRERMPNTETTENKKTSATVKVVFMGIGATVGATLLPLGLAVGAEIVWATVSAAVTAIPGLLGFTSSGIASGSIAAWMMSTSATAYGGGVPAGGLVASLQSISAVGLGASVILVIGGVAVVAGLA